MEVMAQDFWNIFEENSSIEILAEGIVKTYWEK